MHQKRADAKLLPRLTTVMDEDESVSVGKGCSTGAEIIPMIPLQTLSAPEQPTPHQQPPLHQLAPPHHLPPVLHPAEPPSYQKLPNGVCHHNKSAGVDGSASAVVSLGVKIGGSDEDLEDNKDFKREIRVVPPDGGWGWVVVVASFLCNMMVDGIIFTSGLLLPFIMKDFDTSYTSVSLVSSLLGGFYLLAGPFVAGLANAFGFRVVCIIGSLVSATACVISYFASSIVYLYISYGILGGIGFGFIYVPAVIATGFYFDKRRALATGMAVCGSGIGTFTLAPLTNFMLGDDGNWRSALLLYAGLILSCIVFGMAFRPLTAATGKVVALNEGVPNGTPLLMRIKRDRDAQLKASMSDASLQREAISRPTSTVMTEKMDRPPVINPSIARILGKELPSKRNSFHGVGVARGNATEEDVAWDHDALEITSPHEEGETPAGARAAPVGEVVPAIKLDDNLNETVTVPRVTQYKNSRRAGCARNESAPSLTLYKSDFRPIEHTSQRASRVSLHHETSRPFYREDAFYTGSMARLPQYTSSESVKQYHLSVTHIPEEVFEQHEAGLDEKNGCCGDYTTAAKAVLSNMFDFSLCTSPTFLVLSLSAFLALFSLFVPFMFLPSFVESTKEKLGLNDEQAAQTKAFLMSLIGICNTVGRVVCGWISDHPNVDAILVNNVGLIVGGVVTILLPFITNVSLLYFYAMAFGFSVAVFASLRSILLVELLGLEKLTNAFGLTLMLQGIAACIGAPVAGSFADWFGNFTISFYISGAVFALAGVICLPIRRIKQWETNRQEAKPNALF